MSSLNKRIDVKSHDIQTRLAKFQITLALVLIAANITMFVGNRITYTKKHIETEYYNANLTDLDIKRITPSGQAFEGDEQVLKNYLAKYVKYRESKMPQSNDSKMPFIKALSTYQIYLIYSDREREFLKQYPDYMRMVRVDPEVKKLDKGLYQVRFETREMKSLRNPKVFKSSQMATIRVGIVDHYPEHDHRKNINDYDRLNPLDIEVKIYSTANFQFKDTKS